MGETENQQVTDYRSRLVDRMKSRYPDRDFTDTNDTNSPNGLAQSLDETFADYDSKMQEYDENNNRMMDLYKTSGKAGSFFNRWAETKNPAIALREIYGPELLEALQSEEGAARLAEIEAREAQAKADNDAFEEEKTANLQQSFAALDQWCESKGITDENEKVNVFMRFYDILSDALVGKYTSELFEMGWKADHYDEDVANARHEGEVAGRNAKIVAGQQRRSAQAAMPPMTSGQGTRANETTAPREKSWSDYLTE